MRMHGQPGEILGNHAEGRHPHSPSLPGSILVMHSPSHQHHHHLHTHTHLLSTPVHFTPLHSSLLHSGPLHSTPLRLHQHQHQPSYLTTSSRTTPVPSTHWYQMR
ncbi:hypothetical protein KC19_10G135100 [Ceratodon purpureus]|uniref:Uncharacterized protein n=1 Tax=Ceratodon purpureus TaxID=3225 RepID=A0A8T0GK41_CERPU|nr:hypothetical protein KC19_10G135100 [Ceratodon purpureus]